MRKELVRRLVKLEAGRQALAEFKLKQASFNLDLGFSLAPVRFTPVVFAAEPWAIKHETAMAVILDRMNPDLTVAEKAYRWGGGVYEMEEKTQVKMMKAALQLTRRLETGEAYRSAQGLFPLTVEEQDKIKELAKGGSPADE